MRRQDVRTAEQALAYIVDCTMATVSSMALSKTQRKRGEYKRQKAIAQTGVSFMLAMGVDTAGTRAAELSGRTVDQWAAQFEDA